MREKKKTKTNQNIGQNKHKNSLLSPDMVRHVVLQIGYSHSFVAKSRHWIDKIEKVERETPGSEVVDE